jgi:hypothetical protein
MLSRTSVDGNMMMPYTRDNGKLRKQRRNIFSRVFIYKLYLFVLVPEVVILPAMYFLYSHCYKDDTVTMCVKFV